MEIYLNNNSTTKPDKRVLEDFIGCAENCWHNPSDVSQTGLDAKNIIKKAQKQIANSINAKPEEIVFTSGGSESNNWAIKGFLDKYHGVKTIITTNIEHPSVYNTCKYMKSKGYKVVYAPIDKYGRVDVNKLEDLISDNSYMFSLVSIMMANNEIGTLNDIAAISKVTRRYGCILHVDAVQAFMHTEIDIEEMGIDMLSVSFHKFGGFKNCGFLYIRKGIELTPLIHGGHQFDSKRAGTENVPMIYAMGNHVERLNDDMFVLKERTKELYCYTMEQIADKCYDLCEVRLNGHLSKRLFNNMSIRFDGIDASSLITLLELKGIYVSAGSACCAGENTPSKVLKSIGLSDEEAFSTIRVSFGYETTMDDIDKFVDALAECIKSLQLFG
jgi:cysteine desulfurase